MRSEIHTVEQIALVFVGICSALAYGYLAFSTRDFDQPDLASFLVPTAGCALLTIAVAVMYERKQLQVSIPILLAFAVLFRLIALFGLPIFEDDFFRYLWDGRMLVETGNPYGIAPAEFFGTELLDEKFEDILGQINYPHVATIYGPVCQWIFGLAYLIAPGSVWPLQLIFGLADIAIVCMLLRLAKPNWVLLYAWSPLMIKEFAFTAHPDVMGIAMALGALLLLKRDKWFEAAVLLALAAATKVFALVLVPFLLGLRFRAWLVFALTAVLVALPFGILEAWRPEGLVVMAETWLFNAPLYFFFWQWLSVDLIKLALVGLFAILWFAYWIKSDFGSNLHFRGDWIFGLFFLCIPAFNAWYMVWLLPFAVIYPSATAWAASVSLLLAYGIGLNLPGSGLEPYQQPVAFLVIEFLIIALAFTWDIWRYNQSGDAKLGPAE